MENKCSNHDWILLREENFGEMDYNSYGGGVEQFIVRTYVCKNCGEIKKESSGDFNGDSSEFIKITENDGKEAKEFLEKLKEKEIKEIERKEKRKTLVTDTKRLLIKTVIIAILAFITFVCYAFYRAEEDTKMQQKSNSERVVEMERKY